MARQDDENAGAAIVVPQSANKVDKTRVDRAVREIRSILADTVSRGMEEVGTYLLREFYDDNVELCFSMSPTKHMSLNVLAERCETLDLPVSRVFLWRSLRVVAMLNALPKSANFRKLPDSHRVELLSLRNPERVEDAATKAVERKLSQRKLRALVQKDKERNASGRGRPATPAVLKALNACVKALRDEATGKLAFHRADVQELGDEQIEHARAALKILSKRVAELENLLS